MKDLSKAAKESPVINICPYNLYKTDILKRKYNAIYFECMLYEHYGVGFSKNQVHIDGLVQERRHTSALEMELRLSCPNPSMYGD